MKPDRSSEHAEPTEKRIGVAAARVAGGYFDIAKRVAIAAAPTMLAFMCPFIWAFVVYQIMKASDANQRTYRGLLNAWPGDVVIDDEAITIHTDRRAVVQRSEVVDGWIEHVAGEPCVHIRLTRRRRLLIRPNTPSDAEQILDALGIGPDEQTARFPITSTAVQGGQGAIYHLLGPWLGIPIITALVGALVGMIATGFTSAVAPFAVAALMATVIALVFANTVRRRKVMVGRDGFTVMHSAGESFVSYADVTRIELLEDQKPHAGAHGRRTVRVHLAEDTSMDLACGSFAADDQDMATGLHRRLEHAYAAFVAARDEGEDAVALLERRGRSITEWIAELARLVKEGADYRASRLNVVHLAEVVEDVTAPVERRLGAAIALSGVEDKPDLHKRVRIAANTCANPQLRIALEHAHSGELGEAELEAALEGDPSETSNV